MNEALKQRLVGGITLFVLGVVFIPMVLDGPPPGRFEQAADNRARQSEGDDVVTFKPPPPPAKVSVAGADAAPSLPPKPKPVSTAPAEEKTPAMSAQPAPGWIVQVGSFGSKANADGLVKKLNAKGFAANLDTLQGRKGPIYRVYVGPLKDRQKADRTRTSIQALFGMKGLVKKRG